MELLIATLIANWIGQAAGWWGPWFSSKSGGGSGSGGRTGTPGTRVSGPSRGSGGVKKVGSWLGNASGWHDARTDAKNIHGRDDPPVTWGQAWREGMDSGKQRGRERFETGQHRKAAKVAEREAQQAWLEQAEARSGELPDGAEVPVVGRYFRDKERRSTCPDCGHGNTLNNSRVACPCSNDRCACGDPDAVIGPDDEHQVPDYSKPLDGDDEQRWGPPGEAEPAPVDEVAEKRRERDPEPPPTDQQTPDPDPDPAPTGDGDTPEKENDMSAPAAPMPGMTGEFVNYDSARTALGEASSKLMGMSERQTELAKEAADVVAMCDAMMAGLSSVDSDPEDIGDFMALREQAQQNLDAATKAQTETAEASAYCGTVTENINKRHAAIEEAMRAAKHVAKREAYIAS